VIKGSAGSTGLITGQTFGDVFIVNNELYVWQPGTGTGATGQFVDIGPVGSRGATGSTGVAVGLPGAPGAAGNPGSPGTPGPQGPAGATGATGADGVKGDKGETGNPAIPDVEIGALVFNSKNNATLHTQVQPNQTYDVVITMQVSPLSFAQKRNLVLSASMSSTNSSSSITTLQILKSTGTTVNGVAVENIVMTGVYSTTALNETMNISVGEVNNSGFVIVSAQTKLTRINLTNLDPQNPALIAQITTQAGLTVNLDRRLQQAKDSLAKVTTALTKQQSAYKANRSAQNKKALNDAVKLVSFWNSQVLQISSNLDIETKKLDDLRNSGG
jgi:hypothetical protein